MADSKLTSLSEVSVVDLSDDVYLVDNSGPTSYKCGTDRLLGIINDTCDGRLTLTSGMPVTTSDVTGATNIYFTPYGGQCVSLYDGTRWIMYVFTELTLALGTLTSGLPYDVFLYDNAGTLTLELLAWTNGTTRATALVFQNGIYVKTGALTRRYLGTFYTTATTTTEDSVTKRLLYNMYNQVPRQMYKSDATSHTYGTSTVRQWRAQTANKVEVVFGLAQDMSVTCWGDITPSGYGDCGGGLDTTTSFTQTISWGEIAGARIFAGATSYLSVGVGYHYMSLNQDTSGTSTFTQGSISAKALM